MHGARHVAWMPPNDRLSWVASISRVFGCAAWTNSWSGEPRKRAWIGDSYAPTGDYRRGSLRHGCGQCFRRLRPAICCPLSTTSCTPDTGFATRDGRDRKTLWCAGNARRSASRPRNRNALVSLGPGIYLEIIGPDPAQAQPPQPRPFGIDELKEPRLVTWAAKGKNLESFANEAGRSGVKLGQVIDGSRRRTDGVMLSWRYTDPRTVVSDGLVPFFIDWGNAAPVDTAAPGASLIGLRAEHPDPEPVQNALGKLGLDLRVQRGPRAALIATVNSPRGRVELR